MKKFKTLLFILSCLFCLNGFAQNNGQTPFKIISYNIWNGLSEGPECHSKFVNWVKQQNPDVMALEELVGIDAKKLAALGKEYGHPYSAIVKEGGYPVGITSSKPIEVVNKFVEGYWHGMLHVRTHGLDLIVTHLSPFEWKFRLKEAKMITSYIETNHLEKYMVMGDLNAYSPHDADVLESHTTLMKNMKNWDRTNKNNYHNMRGDHFDYSVLCEFFSIGLRDAIQMYVPAEKRMSYPAAFLNKLKWGDPTLKMRGERLDFILVSENLVPYCKNAFVHNGPENEGISDHYPVSVIMQLP